MILNIQTLRVLFTFLVVTAHLESLFTLIGLEKITMALAHVSVDGFIVTSAFLIPYTHAQRPRPPLGFLGRRLARLVPFYWFITFVVAALALAAPQLFQSTTVTWETLLKSLFFIPYFKHDDVTEPIVFVGWTMNYFIFYILLHTLSLKIAGARAWMLTCAVLIALVVCGWIFQPKDAFFGDFTHARQLSFVAGQLLCAWWLHVRDRIVPASLPRWFKPLCIALMATGMTLSTLRDFVMPDVNPRIVGPIFAAMMIAGVIMLDRAGAVHRNALRDRLAEASFAIYLTHYFVTQAMTKIVERFDVREPGLIVVALIAAYVGVGLLGILATRYVEGPLDKFVRAAWNKYTQPSRSDALKAG